MRIGVCEDDPSIRGVLGRALTSADHEVVATHNGDEALRLLDGSEGPAIDVIIMDIGLPDADGRDVVQALRSSGQTAPVLFLTALSGTHDLLGAYAAGADDYVVKPFEIKEILVRVEALARRRAAAAPAPAALMLDPVTHSVQAAGGSAPLTPTEFRMLAAITSQPDAVVRRRNVVAAGWPDGAMVTENTIDSFMRRIRGKLADIDAPVEIETVRGIGFRLVARGS